MPPLLLIYRDARGVQNVPMGTLEDVADHLAAKGLVDTFWENVAGDRQEQIFDLEARLRAVTAKYNELAGFIGHPVKEAAK